MSFGRKGVAADAAMARPARRVEPTPASQSSDSSGSPFAEPGSDMAAKREAFIVQERARRRESANSASVSEHRLDAAIPTPGRARFGAGAAERPSWNPSAEAAERVEYVGSSGGRSRPYAKWLGAPDKRQIALAYVYWYFCGLVSMHRIYCGNLESAIYQVGLLFGSLVCVAIFPPLGIAGFVGWALWMFADLFFIPGMMRRFRERHVANEHEIFE